MQLFENAIKNAYFPVKFIIFLFILIDTKDEFNLLWI